MWGNLETNDKGDAKVHGFTGVYLDVLGTSRASASLMSCNTATPCSWTILSVSPLNSTFCSAGSPAAITRIRGSRSWISINGVGGGGGGDRVIAPSFSDLRAPERR